MSTKRAFNLSIPSHRSLRGAAALALAVSSCISTVQSSAHAASGSWTGAALNSDWTNPLNWDTIPGANNGTFVSTDIATFGDSTNGNAVTVDLNRNVLGMTFNTTATTVGGFAIGTLAVNGGNTLYLSNGGTINVLATNATNTSISIHAPIVMADTTYTLLNNSTTPTSGLKLNSGFTGGASGATTVTLDGTNSSAATTSNSQILGPITNGASSSLSVVKNGTGVWELRPTFDANTYSGDTIINGGLLRLMSTVGSMSPNSNYIINGGTLRPNFNGVTGKSIKVNSGGTLQASADAVINSLNATSGPSLWFNFTGTTGPITMGAFVNFVGTTAGQGGFKLSNQDATGKVSYSKGMDLGTVQRPFDIAQSATNLGADDNDLQVNGAVNGAGGGITKIGPGTLKLNNAANGFTGALEVQQGTVRFNSPDALTAKPAVIISGGNLDVSSLTQTIGALQINSGTISASSGGGGTVATPSISMNVPAGALAQASAVLADSTGSATLTKTGAGTATLTAVNTYTGGTNVNAGTLRIATTGTVANGNLTVNGTGLVHVNAGRPDPLKVAALSVTAGGTVDLNDNDLIVTAGTSNAVRTLIANARNGGAWNLPGLTSSNARNASPKNRGLGVLTGTEYIAVNGTTFGGVAVNNSDVLVKFTWNGDTDFNGVVDFDDYSRTDGGFNNNRTGWLNGDFDYNGIVDFDDYSLIDQAFNTQSGTLRRAMSYLDGSDRSDKGMDAPSLQFVQEHLQQFGEQYAAGFLASVPEPTSALAISGLAGLAASRRRRQRKTQAGR
ncbi:MAG: autotransporter-associated beta strand repeat-containing protein [Anaerolineae bacterium]|nr:autotransporter-associated beta strand repeat-containing protein [Phycisphaerae bacterium]